MLEKSIVFVQIWHWRKRSVLSRIMSRYRGVILEEDYDKEKRNPDRRVKIETEKRCKSNGGNRWVPTLH